MKINKLFFMFCLINIYCSIKSSASKFSSNARMCDLVFRCLSSKSFLSKIKLLDNDLNEKSIISSIMDSIDKNMLIYKKLNEYGKASVIGKILNLFSRDNLKSLKMRLVFLEIFKSYTLDEEVMLMDFIDEQNEKNEEAYNEKERQAKLIEILHEAKQKELEGIESINRLRILKEREELKKSFEDFSKNIGSKLEYKKKKTEEKLNVKEDKKDLQKIEEEACESEELNPQVLDAIQYYSSESFKNLIKQGSFSFFNMKMFKKLSIDEQSKVVGFSFEKYSTIDEKISFLKAMCGSIDKTQSSGAALINHIKQMIEKLELQL